MLSYLSVHEHPIEDAEGNIVDVVVFCSDYCHTQWCDENDEEYGGWNGDQELEYDDDGPAPICAYCQEEII